GLRAPAVDDELLRVLGDLGIEVVQEHPQRRFRVPGPRVQLEAARRPNPREVAAQRVDPSLRRGRDRHEPLICCSTALRRASSRSSRRQRTQLQLIAATKNAPATSPALYVEPPVSAATPTMTTARKPYASTESRYGCSGIRRGGRNRRRRSRARGIRRAPRR